MTADQLPAVVVMSDLLDLQARWEKLINRRAQFREGTKQRSDLDILFHKTLPTIIEIDQSVDDREKIRLIRKAIDQLTEVCENV